MCHRAAPGRAETGRCVSRKWAGVAWRRETGRVVKGRGVRTADAIFFDTYAERYEDMRQFFRALPRILAKGGVFSFFNGMAPFNPFFHGVACEFVKCELNSIGLDCDFVPLQVDQSAHDDKTWDGVKRRYWRFDAPPGPLASHKTTTVLGQVGGAPGGETPRVADPSAARHRSCAFSDAANMASKPSFASTVSSSDASLSG